VITRKACGCCVCVLFADTFTRSDAGTLGTGWSGSGIGIVSNQASSSTADAFYQADSSNPYQNARRAAVTVASDDTGAAGGPHVGYDPTGGTTAFAEWTFGADAGELRIYHRQGATRTLLYGPFVIPGRGAGVRTRVAICIESGFGQAYRVVAELRDADTDALIFRTGRAAYGGVGVTLGLGHGIAVGQDHTGTITFDDYDATALGTLCPPCEAHCYECETICITLPAGSDNPDLQGDHDDICAQLGGGHQLLQVLYEAPWPLGTFFDVVHEDCFDPLRVLCGWAANVPPAPAPLPFWTVSAALHQQDDGWYATAVSMLQTTIFTRWVVWRRFLGTEPPTVCDLNTLQLEWEDVCDESPQPPCNELREHSVHLTLGPDCYYYGYDPPDDLPPEEGTCCEERREGEGMPGTVYATLYNPYTGALIAEDVPLDIDPTAANGFRYIGDLGTHPEGCDTSVTLQCTYLPEEDPPIQYTQLDYFARNTFGSCVGASILIRNIACDPYHGVPDPEVLEGEWDGVEIIE
jgi:hypothetical protein